MTKASGNAQDDSLPPRLLLLMSSATGLAVASNYYAQPLLSTIAQDLNLSTAAATGIVFTAQLSYAAGLLALVPLADRLERRGLIVTLMLLTTLGLLISALAPSQPWLLAGTAIAGACSVVAQVLLPFAVTLASPPARGRAVGIVMSGLLLGILLARVVAGAISTLLHWRAVYALAALAMALCSLGLALGLPRYRETAELGYARLLFSTMALFAQEPLLRLRTALGMLAFALFSLFWTPLAFLLKTPAYAYTDARIGAFGLAGAAGALAATWAGRLADNGKGLLGTWLGLLGLLLAWLPLGFAQHSVMALLAGVLLLDLAVQLLHVSNQNVIYGLREDARNRLNAGYMFGYFLGGAAGSWLATTLYPQFGWSGVTAAGIGLATMGILLGFATRRLSRAGTAHR
jgi:predicted MFS family arabinose efflux permease